MNRTLIIDTGHDIITVRNLEKVWIYKKALIYKLMLKDESQTICLFWSLNRSAIEFSRIKLLDAYEKSHYIVYL